MNFIAPMLVLGVGPDLSWKRTLERWFFEVPIPTALAVFLAGLVVAVVLHKLGRSRGGLISLVAATVLGGAIVGVGINVETVPERLTLDTSRFVKAVVEADAAVAEKLLADSVSFRTDGKLERPLDRDWLLSVVRGMNGVFKSHSLELLETEADGPDRGHTRFLSRAVFASEVTPPIPSTWEFLWKRNADGNWKITSVECLSIYGQSASQEWIAWGNRHRR